MVNYHDPDVVLQDNCAYAFAEKYMGSESQLTFFDSGSVENLACCGWTLLVCLPRRAHKISHYNNPVLISSWEFVTTLDYEWSVIRGHRPYRWTIWVRINALPLFSFFARVRALESFIPFGRCTPLRASSLYFL
jgi:hypothetical protein